VRNRRSALSLLLLAFVALMLGAAPSAASPLAEVAAVSLAQQTGGSFGGSRWGSGSSSSGRSSSSGSSWSGGGRSSSGSHNAGGFDFVVTFIYLVIWCFSVSPILGLAVLGVGLGFILFMFSQSR
jgi:uncharacterized membrane protein